MESIAERITLKKMRTYTELSKLQTFEERFAYLELDGKIGESTFGFDRYLNQNFYRSKEWKELRNEIILRDDGCDLGLCDSIFDDYSIEGPIYIHHMNPILPKDLIEMNEYVMNPEFLVCCSFNTHQAIHYGASALIQRAPIERLPNDTCPWRK